VEQVSAAAALDLADRTDAAALVMTSLPDLLAPAQADAGSLAPWTGLAALALAEGATPAIAPAELAGAGTSATEGASPVVNLVAQSAAGGAAAVLASLAPASATAAAPEGAVAAGTAASAIQATPGPAPASPAPEAAPDPNSLATDATAKYMGAGTLSPAGAAAPAAPGASAEAVAGVEDLPAVHALAANTYSNPHDRNFGQTAAHPSPLALQEPAPGPEDPLEIDLLS
jgi:hypothetical protein